MGCLINPFLFAEAPVYEFDAVAQANSTSSTISVSFGAAHPDRRIIVSICTWRTNAQNSSITAVTIGGVTATPIIQEDNGSSQSSHIYIAAVPTGTSGNIVITTAAYNRFHVQVYRAVGLTSDSAHSTDSVGSTMNLTVPVNGIAIVAALDVQATTPPAIFSITNVTTNYQPQSTATVAGTSCHSSKISLAGESLAAVVGGSPTSSVGASWAFDGPPS